ncbi:MAG: hypothetical protein GYB66_10635 [Chloroflexi bacterium]|nr:hypothetical protein [Chloroflexota bacterium]
MPMNSPYRTLPAWLVLVVALGAVIAYHMPWHVHPAAAFSNNAFDLAEFASLHPDVRNESPKLFTTLLLRLPLIFLGMVITLTAVQLSDVRWQWIWIGVALLIVLRLNPPRVFYPFGGGSINDQQLGYLTIAGLIAIMFSWGAGRWLSGLYHPLMIVIVAVMLGVALNGYARATDLLQNKLALQIDAGGGLFLFVFLGLVLIGLVLWDGVYNWRRRQRAKALP